MFLVNVPVAVLGLVANRLFVPTSRDPAAPPLDVPGALLSIAGLVALVWSIIEGANGWTDPGVIAGFLTAGVLLGAFTLWERRTATPMLDISFFRNPRFSGACGAITMTFFAMFGTVFLLTQYMQFALGYTPLETGVRFLPFAAIVMVGAPSGARLVERVGTKLVVASGLSIAGASLLLARGLTVDSEYVSVFCVMAVLALGMSMVMAPATESIMGSLPRAKAGVGSAVNDTTRQVGGALGVAVLGSVFASSYGPAMRDATAGSGLPAGMHDAVTDQIGAALAVADGLGANGAALAAVARDAFVDGMATTLLVGVAVMAMAVISTSLFLPSRAPGHAAAEVGAHTADHGATTADEQLAVDSATA